MTIKTKSKTAAQGRARLKLAAALAAAQLALAQHDAMAKPARYSVATGARHMPADYWFVQSSRDPGFSASGQYHFTRESAEFEIAGMRCKTEAEYAAQLLAQLTA